MVEGTGVAPAVSGDGSFSVGLTLENRTDRPIPQVFFPCLESFGKTENREDRITFGKSQFQPWVTWNDLADCHTISFIWHSGAPGSARVLPGLHRSQQVGHEVDGFRQPGRRHRVMRSRNRY